MPYELTGNHVSATYLKLVQTVSDNYYDGAGNLLSIIDSSSVNNYLSLYIPEASFGSDFSWLEGNLRVDVSTAGVNKLYVDASLIARDVQINQLDASLNIIRATYIPDVSLSNDFYWNSGLLRVDVNAAVNPNLDYTTYSPFVGDVSFLYTGELVTRIVTVNTIGTKTVDFVYDINDDVSTITIDNYGEASRVVTFEKDVDDNVIAVHIVG